jgi:hypothetical protein
MNGRLVGKPEDFVVMRNGRSEQCASNAVDQAAGPEAGASASRVASVRVVVPYHLRVLAAITGEVRLEVEPPITQRAVLDALERRYPMLGGTTRDHVTQLRRAYLRFYACEQDLSLAEPDEALPEAVARGEQPFIIVSAIAGG